MHAESGDQDDQPDNGNQGVKWQGDFVTEAEIVEVPPLLFVLELGWSAAGLFSSLDRRHRRRCRARRRCCDRRCDFRQPLELQSPLQPAQVFRKFRAASQGKARRPRPLRQGGQPRHHRRVKVGVVGGCDRQGHRRGEGKRRIPARNGDDLGARVLRGNDAFQDVLVRPDARRRLRRRRAAASLPTSAAYGDRCRPRWAGRGGRTSVARR